MFEAYIGNNDAVETEENQKYLIIVITIAKSVFLHNISEDC